VPVDVLRAEVPDALADPPPQTPRPAPSSRDVESMASLIMGWQRPLILAGGGATGASSALQRLATLLGAPVFHTGNGKGAFPASHPLHAGLPWVRATSDLSGMAGNFSPLFDHADGLLAVGCRFSQLTTGSWTLKVPPSLAQIDVDPEEIGRHYPISRALVCDAALGLEALCETLEDRPRRPWAEVPPRPPWRLPGMDLVRPLRRALPADGIVCADVNRLAYVLMADLPLEAPKLFLHPAGAVAMGYGLPAALGAKVAMPDRKVVAILGDGGFSMCAMELATAAQEGIGVVVLLVNDSCLTLIKNTQQLRYGDRFVAVDLANPDFGKLAEAFGVAYARADGDDALEAELRKAFASGRTSVIEVRPEG
jgi:acetolactate synthase-1/2/3 large subunit